jgi:hypothetical protein
VQPNENMTYQKIAYNIVQIEISIGYKTKWIEKNITARFFPTVGIVFV